MTYSVATLYRQLSLNTYRRIIDPWKSALNYIFHTKRKTEQKERNIKPPTAYEFWKKVLFKYEDLNINWVVAKPSHTHMGSLWLLGWGGGGGLEHKGGWNRSGKLRALIWTGAGFLQIEAEKRPLTQTEKETLPPHPLDGAGGSKTPPDQTKDGAVQRRCHSVQMHTNGDSGPFLPSSLHTSGGKHIWGINLNRFPFKLYFLSNMQYAFWQRSCLNWTGEFFNHPLPPSPVSLCCV